MEYSVSAFNEECKRMFDISLPRIGAQGLKLPSSLANMKHCSYVCPGEGKHVFPREMKTATSTVDRITFASYNEGMRHLISACPLAPIQC